MELTIEQRVGKGIRWLESQGVDWRTAIDLERFNIRNPCQCVLGLSFRESGESHRFNTGYWYALEKLAGQDLSELGNGRDLHYVWAEEHGFDAVVGYSRRADFRRLQDEWTRRLTEPPQPKVEPARKVRRRPKSIPVPMSNVG